MTTYLRRVIINLSAAALVAASAGFGAFYAWTTGNHHGTLVGGLFVLMALGLEGAKPFAIEGAFAALRKWSPIPPPPSPRSAPWPSLTASRQNSR